jgi:hypothetical protein
MPLLIGLVVVVLVVALSADKSGHHRRWPGE